MSNDALSALFDGELTGPELDRLLEDLERSPELGRQWTRLCATREAQAGTRIADGQRCICSDVMGRLDAEPAVRNDKVIDLAVRRAGKGRLAAIWKPALGLAAAASVGAAAVLLVKPAAETGTGAPAPQVATGEFRTLPVANSDYRNVDLRDDAHAAMLREYLMDHNSAIGDEGVGGTLRYARFAAYKAEYRPQPDSPQ